MMLLNASDLSQFGIAYTGDPYTPVQVTILQHSLGPIEYLFVSLCVMALTIIVHEWAHYMALQNCLPDTKIEIRSFASGPGLKRFFPVLRTGDQAHYSVITSQERIWVYMVGVVCGGLVIFTAGFIHPAYWLLFAPYALGCHKDLKLTYLEVRA